MNARALVGLVMLVAVPAALVALAGAAPDSTATPRPSAFGDGAADIREWREAATDGGLNVATVVSHGALIARHAETKATLVLVPQPATQPSATLRSAWAEHLEHGGTVVILDGVGTSNRFLAEYGVSIADRRVLDATAEDPETVRGREPGAPPGSAPIVARLPGALVIDEPSSWQVTLETGPHSHLDVNGNGQVDREDSPGPHSLAATLQVPGGGRLIVFTSPTFFADLFVGDASLGNREATLRILGGSATFPTHILIDESQHGWNSREAFLVPLLRTGIVLEDIRFWIALPAAAFCMLLAAIASTIPRVRPYGPHRLSSASVDPRALAADDGFFREIAWHLLAKRSGETLDQVRALGPGATTDTNGLVGRAIRGTLDAADTNRLLQAYNSEVNHHG